MSPEQVQRALDDYFTEFCSMDTERWLATCAEDAVFHNPVGTPPLEGHAALREYFDWVRSLFASIAFEFGRSIIVGDQAAVSWTAHGMMKRGKAVELVGIEILTFNEAGKLQTALAYYDAEGLMTQIED